MMDRWGKGSGCAERAPDTAAAAAAKAAVEAMIQARNRQDAELWGTSAPADLSAAAEPEKNSRNK